VRKHKIQCRLEVNQAINLQKSQEDQFGATPLGKQFNHPENFERNWLGIYRLW